MRLECSSAAGSKLSLILGWIISAIPILVMGVGGSVMLIANPDTVAKGLADHGYPTHLAHTILVLEIGCAVIYAIPHTAVLGAILTTGNTPVTINGQRGEIGSPARTVPRRHARGFGSLEILTTRTTPFSR